MDPKEKEKREEDEAPEDAPPVRPTEPTEPTEPAAHPDDAVGDTREPYLSRLLDVVKAFWHLGFIAFGGPQAHIALFLKVFVEDKKWLDQDRFLELMSLGQAMPGPTSTQMATAIGITRAGKLGGLVAFVLFDWVGFVVCMVIGCVLNAYVEGQSADKSSANAYREVVVGMGPAAISQVFLAAYSLGVKAIGDDSIKMFICTATCLISLLLPSSFIAAFTYLGLMIAGGIITIIDSRRPSRAGAYPVKTPPDKNLLKRMGMKPWEGYLLVFATLTVFVATWVIALDPRVQYPSVLGKQLFALFQTLFKMGMTIYGGGQVVLPMLEQEFTSRCAGEPNYVLDFAGAAVAEGGCVWVSRESFGFGLAIAQSLPGPLFNFSAFLGATYLGIPGGLIGFLGLFAPGVLLIFACMPFWERMRARTWVRCLLVGMNASSIGLIFTACVQLYFKYVRVPGESVVMLLAIVLVQGYKVSVPLAIFSCAALGWCLFAMDAGGPYCHVSTYGNYPTQNAICPK